MTDQPTEFVLLFDILINLLLRKALTVECSAAYAYIT